MQIPPYHSGIHGKFSWLEIPGFNISNLVYQCPEALIGRSVAITAYDSGSYQPDEPQIASGWLSNNGICHVPPVDWSLESIEQLPTCDYTEWYLDSPSINTDQIEVFVNYSYFGFRSWEGPGGAKSYSRSESNCFESVRGSLLHEV